MTFPAGGIDPGETSQFAAVRETEEEAGVLGEVVGDLGWFEEEKANSDT